MTKNKCFILVLLLACCVACATSSVKPPTNVDDHEGDSDTSSVLAVSPINIKFPEAVFTDPKLVAQRMHSKAIIKRLEGLVNATPKGASIYFSIYHFTDEYGLINAIRDADRRGVNLHVMLDMSVRSNNGPTVAKLTTIDKDIEIVAIYNDAKPSGSAINHNKFALFTELSTKNGNVKNVVFTSSENWTKNAETKFNNAVIVSHKGLYKAYLQYWKDVKTRAGHGMVDFTFRKFNALKEDGIMAFFYPKRNNGKYYGPDPIVEILNGITNPSSTTIQIEMAFWTHKRTSILQKVRDLMKQGAKVEIIVRSNTGLHDELVDLANQGAYVKMFNYTKVPDVKQIKLHSKVMLIWGKWKGKETKLVITGSENYTGPALKYNNENNILLSSYHFKHPKFFKRFEDNFNAMKTLPGTCCANRN